MNTNYFKVAAFYSFIELSNIEHLQKIFIEFFEREDIKGTLLLAQEGLNGTVAGKPTSIDKLRKIFIVNIY